MLSFRIDREEQVLFPKLVEIGMFLEREPVWDSSADQAQRV
jgi:hypothetical protein